MAEKKKTHLYSSGRPAPETPLGEIYDTANSLEGKALPQDNRVKVPLRGPKPSIKREESTEQFKLKIKNFLVSYRHLIDNPYFPDYAFSIYNALCNLVKEEAVVLLEGYEPWRYIESNLEAIKLDPLREIPTIKYNILYLEALYPFICKYLDHPESGYNLNRAKEVPEDQLKHIKDIEEMKKFDKEQERKKEEAKLKKEHEKLQEQFEIGNGNGGDI